MSAVHPIEDPTYPSSVTVACVNFESVPRDKAATVAKIEAHVRDAARQGAQHLDEAELVPGPTTEYLATLAGELDIYLVLGMNELDPDDPTRIYNAAALVGPEGIQGTFRKIHLGHPLETCRHSPGDELPIWETRMTANWSGESSAGHSSIAGPAFSRLAARPRASAGRQRTRGPGVRRHRARRRTPALISR